MRRITSYNVCYTKLLRPEVVAQLHPGGKGFFKVPLIVLRVRTVEFVVVSGCRQLVVQPVVDLVAILIPEQVTCIELQVAEAEAFRDGMQEISYNFV